MLLELKLQIQPTSLDNLTWSTDGELAVAAGEFLEIYIPKLTIQEGYFPPKSAFDQWDIVKLRINKYTTNEVPELELSSTRILSLGEEQSNGSISSLKWSPPGLGRYGRSVLGLLSSNLILSVWASNLDRTDKDDWQRVLIVNHALEKHFQSSEGDEGHNGVESEELSRLRRRIRAFDWSHSRSTEGNDLDDNVDSSLEQLREQSIIAAANDNSEIILLKVYPPPNVVSQSDQRWAAKVLESFEVKKPPTERTLSSIRKILHTSASQISFSPWLLSQDGSLICWMAYNFCGVIRLRLLTLKTNNDRQTTLAVAQEVLINHSSSVEPYAAEFITWDAEIRSGGWTLAVRHANCIEVISIETKLAAGSLAPDSEQFTALENTPTQTIPFDCWEPIAGMKFNGSPSCEASTLHINSHLNQALAVKHNAEISLKARPEGTHWQRLVRDYQRQFDLDHELHDNTLVRVWGMDRSPTAGTMAVCFSLHPSDMLEYVTAGQQECFVVFGKEYSSLKNWFTAKSGELAFPIGPRLSTEAFILGALHDPSPLIRYKGPEEGSEASLIKELRSVLAKAGDRPIWTWHSALKFEHVLGRLENLATTKDAQPSDQFSDDTAILGWLLQSILSYPRDGVATSDISLRILYIAARRVLNELPRPSTPPELENDSEMALHWLRHDSGRDLDNDPVFIESCDFCGSQIGLTKSAQAYCTGEIPHFFDRCSLTFLAIQAPGITKYCGICGRQYLTDAILTQAEKSMAIEFDRHTADPSKRLRQREPALALELLKGCHTCYFCGGKFVGTKPIRRTH